MKLGYMIPEFPGQTHIWHWREIEHMRKLGFAVELFSTRHPPEPHRAKHAFADGAEESTFYAVPRGWGARLMQFTLSLIWALVTRPRGLLRALALGFTLPVDAGPPWRHVLPLVLPACGLARRASRAGVEHLHCHTCANGAVLAMMNRRLTGITFSMTLNANIEWWGGAMAEKLADAEFTIAITQRLLDQIRRDFPHLLPDKAILGRIGVDTRKWLPTHRADRMPGEPTRLVSVGRLSEGKGHHYLIRAVAQLVASGHDVMLHILGDGPYRTPLESLIDELGLARRIVLLGSVSEERVMSEITESEVFILASYHEPLGVAYMEAMALGAAVIGTSAGGVAEIITHGADGLLVPPKDVDALCQAITRLIDDPALRVALGTAGRQTIVEHFDSRFGAMTLCARLTQCHASLRQHSAHERTRRDVAGRTATSMDC